MLLVDRFHNCSPEKTRRLQYFGWYALALVSIGEHSEFACRHQHRLAVHDEINLRIAIGQQQFVLV